MTRLSAAIRMILSILLMWGFTTAIYFAAPRLAIDLGGGYWGMIKFVSVIIGFCLVACAAFVAVWGARR